MTYATTEESLAGGKPYYLYTFTQGLTITRKTSADVDVTYSGNVYSASSIDHNSSTHSGDLERVGIQLFLPKSDSFASSLFSPNYTNVVTLTIQRGHFGVDDVGVVFKGRVISYEASVSEIILTCESIQTTMRRSGVRAKYLRTCRHDLYGDLCGLNIADYYINATVDSISGLNLTMSFATADEQADNYFTGGVIEKDGVFGFIRSDLSNVLTLQYIPDGIEAGSSVRVAPGCNLRYTTCREKFNNGDNFGGFPYMPSENVFDGFNSVKVAN